MSQIQSFGSESTPAPSQLIWESISVGQTLEVNHGYLVSNTDDIQLLLPTISSVGDIIVIIKTDNSVAGKQIIISQGDNQQVWNGAYNSTLGTSGSTVCNIPGASISLVCGAQNFIWYSVPSASYWNSN